MKFVNPHRHGRVFLESRSSVRVIPGTLFTLKGEKIGKTNPGFLLSGKLEVKGDFVCKEFEIFVETKRKLCVNRTKLIRLRGKQLGVSVELEIRKLKMIGGPHIDFNTAFSLKRASIEHCFVKGLSKRVIDDGELSFLMKVGTERKVISSSIVRSSLNAADIEKCVGKFVKRMRFDKIEDVATITFRLSFSLKENVIDSHSDPF